MNIQKTIASSILALLVVALSAGMAAAYTIDGDLSDWGVAVNTGGNWGQTATWLPTNAGVQFQVENNVDPKRDAEPTRWHDNVSAYATGVHISGISPDYADYDESRVTGPNRTGWAFPTGASDPAAEKYDLEAMYVDEDNDHLYFAIVLSCNAASVPGDLGLDVTSATGDGYDYEYGVVIHDSADTYTASSRDIKSVSDWSECTVIAECSPYRILDGTTVGTATVAYVKNGPDPEPDIDSIYPATYIIEGKIPKNVIGNPASVSLHYTVECGNDEIIIQKRSEPPEEQVPALTPSGIIALIGMLCVIGMSRIGRRFN